MPHKKAAPPDNSVATQTGNDLEQEHDALQTEAEGAILGYFDGCDALWVRGWLKNAASDQQRREVEVLVDGILLQRLVAEEPRPDLVHAQIGDGNYGFKLLLPVQFFDGLTHQLEARDAATGQQLEGSPFSFHGKASLRGDVRIEGAALVGWALSPYELTEAVTVEVVEGNQMLASGPAHVDDGTRISFRCALPNSVFDGRAHHLTVRSTCLKLELAEFVDVLPPHLTPEEALRAYARAGFIPSLCTTAGFRYDALVASLEEVAAGNGLDVSRLKQAIHAHAVLVRGFKDTDTDFEPLRFPEHPSPDVSLVIPVHNKFPVTYHCLVSLLLAANRASFEVILVDDGSTDQTTKVAELIAGITCLRNEEAQGFVRSCNRGATHARGRYIVMLNNDTEVTNNWLDELIWPFDHFDQVGMTGAKLLYPDGTLQEAGGVVWNTGDPWNYGRKANPHDPRFNYARQVDYLSGACIMLPATLWNELGGFDELYTPAYFEDTDLAFRVREKGLKTVYTPLAQIVHFEGVSSGTSTASGTKRFQEINRPKFKKRWLRTCRDNGRASMANLEQNKERNVELRALVLDAETPMPDQNAGSYAAIQEIRMLQALGFKCTFVPNNLAWMGHYTKELQRMGVECLYSPFVNSINQVIQQRGNEFDLVYITRYYVAQQYVDQIRKHAPQAKIVMNNADLHFLRELRAGIQAKDKQAIVLSVETREKELAVMNKVDLVLSYTDVEKAVIQSHNLDLTLVAKCPWVVETVPKVPRFEERCDIAFLGGYNHHPNAEAVEWFVEQVMPLLRQQLPQVVFKVYGSHVPKRLHELAEKHENISIAGWVPTVDAVYNTCRVFVAPLQSGAGIKGKVIGALAHGVPCVLSQLAAEGIPVADGVDACVADKPEEWVAAIVGLYQNQTQWQAMSVKALGFAERLYGFDKGVAQMQEALQQVDLVTSTEHQTLVAR